MSDGLNVKSLMVGGLPVAVLNREETAKLTVEQAVNRRGTGKPPLFFTTANGQVVSLCSAKPEVRKLYETADLISPDGMSVVVASRIFCRESLPERVSTTDAFHDTAQQAMPAGASFYFLGASEAVNRDAVEGALRLYPGLKIAGRRNGFFKLEDEPKVIEEINQAAPDILWIGLGVPKQQEFVVRNRDKLTKVGLIKTCGGLFDFLAGRNSRAPEWMQSAGLEWLYRVSLEPRRLFLRYLLSNPHAIYVLSTQSGDSRRAA